MGNNKRRSFCCHIAVFFMLDFVYFIVFCIFLLCIFITRMKRSSTTLYVSAIGGKTVGVWLLCVCA